jgi:ferredoxin-type protein NapG
MTDLDRRAFFKRGLKKVSQTVVKYADNKLTENATKWIRPPFSINELDFVISCNRCGDCISACTHEVIFPLTGSYGASVVGTPAMDLNNKGCHLCKDWPCVSACETNTLKLPELNNEDEDEDVNQQAENIPLPRMAIAKISAESCLPFRGPECGACNSSCPVEGALIWNMVKPAINSDACVGCGLCRQSCITNPSSITIHHLSTAI